MGTQSELFHAPFTVDPASCPIRMTMVFKGVSAEARRRTCSATAFEPPYPLPLRDASVCVEGPQKRMNKLTSQKPYPRGVIREPLRHLATRQPPQRKR